MTGQDAPFKIASDIDELPLSTLKDWVERMSNFYKERERQYKESEQKAKQKRSKKR